MSQKVNEETLKITVCGRVQGVGFRYYTVEIANKLNIKGSVRNTYNGNVEIIAQAPKEDLHLFIDYIRKGPALSNVTDLKMVSNAKISEKNFKIRY